MKRLSSSYDSLISMISQPSCKLKSLLLANEPSINIKSFIRYRSNGIYLMPRSKLSSCYFKRLFRALISSSEGSQYYITIERSNEASGQHIVARQALRARCSRYSSIRVSDLIFTSQSFFSQPFQTRTISSPSVRKMPLLKINRVSSESVSTSLALSLAFSSSSCSSFIKLSSLKIKVSSVYIPITLKASLEVVINKHGSYEEVSIPSFSQQCLLYVAYQ